MHTTRFCQWLSGFTSRAMPRRSTLRFEPLEVRDVPTAAVVPINGRFVAQITSAIAGASQVGGGELAATAIDLPDFANPGSISTIATVTLDEPIGEFGSAHGEGTLKEQSYSSISGTGANLEWSSSLYFMYDASGSLFGTSGAWNSSATLTGEDVIFEVRPDPANGLNTGDTVVIFMSNGVGISGELPSGVGYDFHATITTDGQTINADEFGQFVTTVGSTFEIDWLATLGGTTNFAEDEFGNYGIQPILSLSAQKIPDVKLTVTADMDDVGTATDKEFGTYLAGVKLPITLTITADDPTAVRYLSINVGAETKVVSYTTAGAKFTFNPGLLPAGDANPLTIVPLNASKQPAGSPYSGKVKVSDTLPLELLVNVPGKGEVAASELRLIDGVKGPSLQFKVKTELPLNAKQAYLSKMALTFVNKKTNKHIQKVVAFVAANPMGKPAQATTSIAATTFKDTVTDTGLFDYDVYLTPQAKYSATAKNPKRLGLDNSARIFVLDKPLWLANAKASYSGAQDLQDALGAGAMGYAFKFKVPAIKLNLPVAKATSFGLFDGLKSNLSAEVSFSIFARLTGSTGDATLRVGDLDVGVMILGDQLFNATLTPQQSGMVADGAVNPRTLAALATLTVSTSTPIDLLSLLQQQGLPTTYEKSFGDGKNGSKKWQITGLPITLPIGTLASKFFLQGNFKTELSELQASAALVYKLENNRLTFDRAASWVQTDVQAEAVFNVKAGVDLAWSPLPTFLSLSDITIDVFQARVLGSVEMGFAAQLRANFESGGKLLSSSKAGVYTSYDLNYAVALLPDGEPDESSYQPLAQGPLVEAPLFGLGLPVFG